MNCRDFIIEFEDRNGDLTEAATLHVKICADCQKTSREQTQMWLMIDNLRRIDAPNDFDFRVKARIAQGKPADFQPRFFPALRYVLPLGLIVLILGAFAFNTTYFSGGDAPQIVEVTTPQTPIAADNPASNFSTPEQIIATVNPPQPLPVETTAADSNTNPVTDEREFQFVPVKSTKKLLTESRRTNRKKSNDGGSRVIASTSTNVLVPDGFNPNNSTVPLPSSDNKNPITDVQILNFIGIETISENGGKKVKSLKPKSLAEISGIKTGDIIEAIDGKQIGDKPMLMETSESKKITVVRDAKKIEIVLQNKSN